MHEAEFVEHTLLILTAHVTLSTSELCIGDAKKDKETPKVIKTN
jgi:hypothetical protein